MQPAVRIAGETYVQCGQCRFFCPLHNHGQGPGLCGLDDRTPGIPGKVKPAHLITAEHVWTCRFYQAKDCGKPVDNLEDYESDIAWLLLYQPNVSESVALKFADKVAFLVMDEKLTQAQARRDAYNEYFPKVKK